MVVRVCPPVTSEPLAALGHLRTTSHDNSYAFPFSGPLGKRKREGKKESFKPQTKAIFYLELTPLQHIKR